MILPLGWLEICLGEITTGFTSIQPASYPQQEFRYIDIGSIDNVANTVKNPKTVTGLNAPSRARRLVRPGDVLFSTVRPYLRNIARVPVEYDGQLASTGLCVLRPSAAVDPNFLFYQVVRDDFVKKVSAGMDGTMYPAVRDEDVLQQSVPLPPLVEQRRIVERLEDLLARARRARSTLESIPPLLERFRKSVLAAAFRGQLTADWREAQAPGHWTETQDQILNQGMAANKYRSKQAVDDDAPSLPPLPTTWRWCQLGDCASIQGGIQKQPSRRPQHNPYPFLRVANVYRGRLDLEDVHQIEVFDGELDRLRLKAGDLLVVEGNGSADEVGRLAVWNGEIDPCVHQNHLIRVRLSPLLLPQLVEAFLASPHGRSQVFSRAQTTTGLYNLGVAKVAGLPVPLMPMEEQELLIERLHRILAAAESVESFVRYSIARTNNAESSILSKAFRGELVPQDPNDEPASVLLERIRAEREATGGNGKKRRRTRRSSG